MAAPRKRSAARAVPEAPPARAPSVREVVVGRWDGAAERLHLAADAVTLGRLLAVVELSPSETEASVPRTRAGLLRLATASGLQPSAALDALAELAERGVVDARDDGTDWLAASVQLAAAVRARLLGRADRSLLRGAESAILPRLAAEAHRVDRRALIVVRGPEGSGRDHSVRALLASLGAPGVARTPSDLARTLDVLEPELSGAVPIWDARAHDATPDDRRRGAAWLARGTGPAMAILDSEQELPSNTGRAAVLFDTDSADDGERLWAWRVATRDEQLAATVSAELRVGVGLACRAAESVAASGRAFGLAALRDALERLVAPASRQGIVVERPTTRLDDVVLPDAIRRGLAHAALLGRTPITAERVGVKVLLSGAPGTGKTLAARALAATLERPLYRVDLATVVSKWLGETEKNLRRAFVAARAVGAVLLFDEGEALMGQRGEVARGTDRYANLEVAYLLQALEAYDGIVVVTTNARSKLDGAFLRRFDIGLDFPKPEQAARIAIWKRELGADGSQLSEKFLADVAHRAELSGGHIAAAARLARALAADDRRALREADVLEAVAFEYDKLSGGMSATRFREEAAKRGSS